MTPGAAPALIFGMSPLWVATALFVLTYVVIMSSLETSAMRRSRSVLAAVVTAFFAASSHETLLVPMTSVTRYTPSVRAFFAMCFLLEVSPASGRCLGRVHNTRAGTGSPARGRGDPCSSARKRPGVARLTHARFSGELFPRARCRGGPR